MTSVIRQIFDQLPKLNEERKKQNLLPILNLSIGQPYRQINPAVTAALSKPAYLNTANEYTPTPGTPEAREAVRELYKEWYPKVGYTAAECMVTSGATNALTLATNVLLKDGGDIATFIPYFGPYGLQMKPPSKLIGIASDPNTFKPDLKALERTLKNNPNIKGIIINYPNNPSGVTLNRQEVEALVAVLNKYPNVNIILDDVYRELSHEEHISLLDVDPSLKARTFTVNSGSKSVAGAPSLRIGMMAASEHHISAMSQEQIPINPSASIATHVALTAAVQSRKDLQNTWWKDTLQVYKRNRDFVFKSLQEMGMAPQEKPGGAFYMVVNAKNLIGKTIPSAYQEVLGNKTKFENDVDITYYFIHAAGVAMVPGSGFGFPTEAGFLRLSYSKPIILLKDGLNNIKKAVDLVNNAPVPGQATVLNGLNNAIKPNNTAGKTKMDLSNVEKIRAKL